MKLSKRIEILLRFYKAKTKYFEEEELNPAAPSAMVKDIYKEVMKKEIAMYKNKASEVETNMQILQQKILMEFSKTWHL